MKRKTKKEASRRKTHNWVHVKAHTRKARKH